MCNAYQYNSGTTCYPITENNRYITVDKAVAAGTAPNNVLTGESYKVDASTLDVNADCYVLKRTEDYYNTPTLIIKDNACTSRWHNSQ